MMVQLAKVSGLPSCPANPVAVSVPLPFPVPVPVPVPFADPETQTSVGLAAINRLSRQLKTL